MTATVIASCAFQTERLDVVGWHDAIQAGDELATVVAGLLTPAVTASLPPDWQDSYTTERARRWIEDRDAEGTTLLVSEREASSAVGLVLLYEEPAIDGSGAEVRIGYLLAERTWGRGFGGELVAGLVGWCRTQPAIVLLIAGVAPSNTASIRILERSGFSLAANSPGDELEYRLGVQRGAPWSPSPLDDRT
jgi:ribosomal-protein-alanine N-acetyltransferase